MEKVIIIGAVGTARNIIEQIQDARDNYGYEIEIRGILIDSFHTGTIISEVNVIGSTSDISKHVADEDNRFIFCLHKPELLRERYRVLESYRIPLERFTNFIHPLSFMSQSVSIGKGNAILSNSTIQADVKIGNFNIINSNVTIEHETTIGNFNFVAANSCIGAKVKVGDTNFIGLNSSIRENVELGNNVFIGMHSLVLKNYSDCLVYGSPAKKYLRQIE